MRPGDPLTILHLAANRWWTGSAEPIIRLVSVLRARGHRVLLGLVAGDRFEEKAREAGIEPVPRLSLEARVHPLRLAADVVRLRRLVGREGVAVIHAHHSHDHWLAWLVRGPAVLVRTFHNLRAVRSGWPAAALYRRTDALLAVSRAIEERCRQVTGRTQGLHRVEGVVDLGRFAQADGAPIRREFNLGGRPVVGSVARLAPDRGHELLIRGFRLLLSDHPDARLLLVGKGEARPRLEALVRELGLDKEVLFTGYRDADLPQVLAALDVFALMGTGSDESARAALEAMAAGRPVVARPVGALPETLLQGTTGLLLEHESPEAVAAALDALVRDAARARAMGEAGRRRALERFSPERHAAQVEAIYREALGRRRA
jgi:glycosyltransferase involved in cell wall biosynthesis